MLKNKAAKPYLGTTQREPSVAVYPLKSTKRLRDLETWSHLSVIRFLGRLTVYNFSVPPEVILDLGCGTGVWVVNAAKEFKSSTIVGLDLEDIQPPLDKMGCSDIARRVRWVHGNL